MDVMLRVSRSGSPTEGVEGSGMAKHGDVFAFLKVAAEHLCGRATIANAA